MLDRVGEPHGRVLGSSSRSSMQCNAMGIEDRSLGIPEFANGPLRGVLS